MPDYKNSKIYKIVNNTNSKIYIGHTTKKLNERFTRHLSSVRANKNPKSLLYNEMKEIGIINFKIELIEDFPCNNMEELRKREEHWRIELKSELNTQKCFSDKKEYMKNYRIENKEIIKEKSKIRYEEKKEEINAKRREKRKENKSDKITCECGSELYKEQLSRHKKSQKHVNFLKNGKIEIINKSKNFNCECGSSVIKKNKYRHLKSKLHKGFIEKRDNKLNNLIFSFLETKPNFKIVF